MKNILTFLAVFVLCAFTPPCDLEVLLKQQGNWLQGMPNAPYSVSAADLARQREILNSIVIPLQTKLTPRGVDIEVNNAHFPESRLGSNLAVANYYTLDFTLAKHDCPYDRSQIMKKLAGAYDILPVRIHVNDFAFVFGQSFFVPTEENKEDPLTDIFVLIDEKPVKEGAAWYWKNGGGRKNTTTHMWLISMEGKLPFEYISKKEFATRLKEYYLEKIKEVEWNFSNNMKTAEESYQQIKGINAAEAEKFKEGSAIQYKKELDFGKGQYLKNIAVVDKILQTSDANALAEPAIIDHIKGYFDFQGFVGEDHDFANYVIKPNPAYFNPKLPKSSPQFMTVYYDELEEEIFKIGTEELLKAIDFAALQAMLGK